MRPKYFINDDSGARRWVYHRKYEPGPVRVQVHDSWGASEFGVVRSRVHHGDHHWETLFFILAIKPGRADQRGHIQLPRAATAGFFLGCPVGTARGHGPTHKENG